MNKHIHLIPSVIVLFYELDWDDTDYKERVNDCATLLENIRLGLFERGCKIALVLLQKSLAIPLEDNLTTERATHLCDTCDIPAKSLFVLPYQDTQHFYGYIIR